MNNHPSQAPDARTRELLEYWICHPQAQSTVEAIVEWWLLERRIQRVAAEVRAVLSELVAREFVVPRHQADGRICYRLNQERKREICEWLQLGRAGNS